MLDDDLVPEDERGGCGSAIAVSSYCRDSYLRLFMAIGSHGAQFPLSPL